MTPGSRDSLQKPIPVTASSSDTDLVLGRLLGLDPGLAKAWNEQADWSYVMGGPVLELAEEELRALDSVLPIGGVVAQLLTEYGGNIIVIIFLVVSFVCMCLRVVFINIPYFYYLYFISKCVPSYSIEWCTYVGIMTHSQSPGL